MILAAGIGLGLGYNALRAQPLPWVAEPLPKMTSLDSLGTSSDSTSGSLAHPQIIELGKDTTTAQVERQHITTMPVQPPVGVVDSVTRSVTKIPPSSTDTTTLPPSHVADTTSKMTPPPAYSDIPESEDPIKVTLAQTKRFFDRGGVVILDARDPEEYAEGHIQGAISAPTDTKMGDIEWLQKMAKDPRPIICYCSGGDCELSIELATELTRTGHRRVLVFEEGFPAWQTAGYPVVEGTSP